MDEPQDSTQSLRNAQKLNTNEEYGESSSVDFGRKTRVLNAPQTTIEESREFVESTNRSGDFCCEREIAHEKTNDLESKPIEADIQDDRMCRICFSGPEEDGLGRLISPCLCKGTMRYVHVECLNHWRLRSQKKTSFFQCDECKYKYAFRRTTMAKFATNKLALTLVTFTLFAFCVFVGGFLAKFLLYIYFSEDDSYDDEESDSLFGEPITITTILTIDYLHIALGFMFIGFVGFLQLLLSLMWFGPIPSWNSFRFGPTGSGRGAGRGADWFTAIVLSIIILVGVLKAIWGIYKLVNSASRKILERVELTILEVNER
ncbi:2688_t:CDS:2 [Acaulospora morrowiae]|uniref:2688_t:CDS:1 n=1 Tax=Acaulospora morrowiae TaxID=94023 RepID=A0A9N9E1H8_9GLOM|nr:2688_t:CDS:2 [Acaulospora morrowiae]